MAHFLTSSVGFRSIVRASHQNNAPTVPSGGGRNEINRRNLSLGLVAATFLVLSGGDGSARAAGRRAPAPAPAEKKDPSLSALQAKILASKRRKEAMKQEIAKLRQKGKTVQPQPEQAIQP